MIATVHPGLLSGTVPSIASKSDAHRLLILAALADSPTRLTLTTTSKDIEATCRCLTALGATILREKDALVVTPIASPVEGATLDCEESGSTLRFMVPVAAAVTKNASFIGRGRLPERPIGELVDALTHAGASFSAPALPFQVTGGIHAGTFRLPGNVSSQYITGLMLALPLLEGDSEIVLTTPLQSASYVAMTIDSLRQFHIVVRETSTGWIIPGSQKPEGGKTIAVDADWSNAAFFLAAGALGGDVTVTGLRPDSVQGDKAIIKALQSFGATVTRTSDGYRVAGGDLKGTTLSLEDTPDMLPILAIVATKAQGITRFTNAERLRIKESDRLSAVRELITRLGGKAQETTDGMIIEGSPLSGGEVDGKNDHRIVMAAAVAATVAAGPVTIEGAQAIAKSYPAFFEDFNALKGHAYVK